MSIRRREVYSYKGRGVIAMRHLMLGILLGLLLIFALLSGWIAAHNRDDIRSEPQFMVILGCQVKPWGPSILLQDRLDKALPYLEQHPELPVIVSGGQGRDEPSTEAKAMADYLRSHGIDESRILLEENSHNTLQNLKFSLEKMEQAGSNRPESVLVVSNGFHLARVHLIWGRLSDIELSTLAAPSTHAPSRQFMYVREPIALVKSFLLDR